MPNVDIAELDSAAQQEAERDAVARLLQTHPGVGPITALAFSLTLGTIERFAHSRQVISYLGLNPAEDSRSFTAADEKQIPAPPKRRREG